MLRCSEQNIATEESFMLFLVGFLPFHNPLAMHLFIFFLALLCLMSAFYAYPFP